LAAPPGYLLYVAPGESRRRWTGIKARFGFSTITQDGDDEGCFKLDRLPTEAEGQLIRAFLGIRRRRHLTEEAKARLLSVGFQRTRAKLDEHAG
jgi:hypothetical protein